MDNVNFDAKTDWKLNDTVMPADANRWEKGIKDCADLVNNHNEKIPLMDAETAKKVNKSGDTMTGPLKMSGGSEIRFGTDDDFYSIRKNSNGDLLIYNKVTKGLFLYSGDNKFAPYYYDGTKGYRLLTSADLQSLQTQINSLNMEVSKMLGRMNFSAAVSTSVRSNKGVPSTFYSCPVDGYLFIPDTIDSSAKATVFVNNIAVSKKEASDDSNSNGVWTLMPLPVSAGDSVGIARSGTGVFNTPLIFVPQK